MPKPASEKTEKATPKKRLDARKEGQVLKSTEVNTAICSIIMFAFLFITWASYADKLIEAFSKFLSAGAIQAGNNSLLTLSSLNGLYTETLLVFAKVILPLLGVAVLAGLISNILQVGFLFTTKALKPKFSRINPLEGFKRIFSARTVVDLLKSILKVILLGYILYSDFRKLMDIFGAYMGLGIYGSFIQIMRTALSIALKMCLVLSIIAAFDYFFQWRKYEKDLMMTKQEIKDEYKHTEGDPLIKSKIRQKQRQMSAMRMMDSIPGADVVITNPTHYAIALRYKHGENNAPVIVAKGQDYLARKIKEKAREYDIEIVENKPLAQALYAMCEIGSEIPSEFYQAVADILVYVSRRKNIYRH